MVDRHFLKQIKGFSLTTAEILYHLPDHPALLQSFIWQEYDVAPRFPRLHDFLKFWTENLDGTLSHVVVAHRALVQPASMRFVEGRFRLT